MERVTKDLELRRLILIVSIESINHCRIILDLHDQVRVDSL